jgi:hypothetical protein
VITVVKISGDLGPNTDSDKTTLAAYPENQLFELVPINEKKRTLTQNKAMYTYFTLLADALNDAGYDMKKVLKENVDIPWTKDAVMEYLWRPIQKICCNKTSSTELSTSQPSEIYLILSRHISQKFGVNVEWPSKR